ncbi:MAG: hypothetical protein ABIN37_01785 [Burkholderiaceae bacterium]
MKSMEFAGLATWHPARPANSFEPKVTSCNQYRHYGGWTGYHEVTFTQGREAGLKVHGSRVI